MSLIMVFSRDWGLNWNGSEAHKFFAARALQSFPGQASSFLKSNHLTFFKAVTAKVVFGLFTLKFWSELVGKITCFECVTLILAFKIHSGVNLTQSRFKLSDSFYKRHLLQLGTHKLLLQFHKALRKFKDAAPYGFFISKGEQAFSYICRRLCAGDPSREPIKHAHIPGRVIWHREFSIGGQPA